MVCRKTLLIATLVPLASWLVLLPTLVYLHRKYKKEERELVEENKRAKNRIAEEVVVTSAAPGAANGAGSGGSGQEVVTKTNPATGEVVTEVVNPAAPAPAPAPPGQTTEVVRTS